MSENSPVEVAGPCACPGCYVYGCDYCAAIGCTRHIFGQPYLVPPTGMPLPIVRPYRATDTRPPDA